MNHSKAFSLVELMMVVGIIGMLSIMGNQSYQRIKLIAKRTVAISNLRLITSLIVAEQDSGNGVGYGWRDSDNYDAGSAPTGDFRILLSTNITTSPTSCHVPNVYNFKVKDCTKAYYRYSLLFRQQISSGPPIVYQNTSDGSWYLRAESVSNGYCQTFAEDIFKYCPGTKTICLEEDALKSQCGAIPVVPFLPLHCQNPRCAGQP